MLQKLFLFSLFLVGSCCFYSCNSGNNGLISSDVVNNPNTANGSADQSKLPNIEFEEEIHDFGKIIEGETVSYSFKFKNTGKSDLIIADVSTSCGCTVPSFPKTPIKPGKEDVIRIAFNSAGRRGYQIKNIVIVSNTQPNTKMLRIKSLVVSPGSDK